MLKRSCLIWLFVPFMVLGLAALGTGGGKIEEFSAKQVYTNATGKVEGTATLHAAPRKMRIEMAAPDGRGRMINIVRQDKGVFWLVFPEKKAYMERPLTESESEDIRNVIKNSPDQEDLGRETVNGFKCRKKRITRKQKIMGREVTTRMTVWMSDRLDWPIRSRTEDGSTMELRDIKEGRQPKELFEPPAGYRKAANMMELMK